MGSGVSIPATEDAALAEGYSQQQIDAYQAERDLLADPDVVAEAHALEQGDGEAAAGLANAGSAPAHPGIAPGTVRLSVIDSTHTATRHTALLLRQAGGAAAVHRATAVFYQRFFDDKVLEQFIRKEKGGAHATRLGNWIVEKFGGAGCPWSDERRGRGRDTAICAGGRAVDVHDRTTAHVAAWHSAKRAPENVGRRFKIDDARMWMRLHFWAARETGLLADAAFAEYYVKFIAHFVRVYERGAPQFARTEARWSAGPGAPQRIAAYAAAGNVFEDLAGLTRRQHLAQLPAGESADEDPYWPYR